MPHEKDQFEKAYHEKHPEVAKREIGQYGEGRPEWAMSSDDLNKSVRATATRGSGLGMQIKACYPHLLVLMFDRYFARRV